MTDRANEPAYPVMNESYPARDGDYTKHETIGGLTIREHFAGMAMQGFCANPNEAEAPPIVLARGAVAIADALIAALAEGKIP